MKRDLEVTFKQLIKKYTEYYKLSYNEALETSKLALERITLMYVVGTTNNELYDINVEVSHMIDKRDGIVFTNLAQAKIFQIRKELKNNSYTPGYLNELETELEELGQEFPQYII